MIQVCPHHAQCKRTRIPTFTQRTLINASGLLFLSPRPPPVHRRTRPPGTVRRITNTPTYSTTNPSLTNFLRFPSEIRLQIYRLLLTSSCTIQYGLCPVAQRLVARQHICMHRWARHGLFPSILQCCRTINREGSAVLYGENCFWVERSLKSNWLPVVDSWGPGRTNLDMITRLEFSHVPWGLCARDRRELEVVDLLPGLRELRIDFDDVCAEEWEGFLETASDRFWRLDMVLLRIYVGTRARTRMCEHQWPADQSSDEERSFWMYVEPLYKHEAVRKKREVRWTWEECMDDLSLLSLRLEMCAGEFNDVT